MSTEPDQDVVDQSHRTRWLGRGIAAVVAALLAFVLVVAFGWRSRHNDIVGPPLLKVDAKQLKQTVVSPHLEAAIEPGKNVLWCSTFQLVWNESCRYAGGDIRLKDEPAAVPILNKKTASENDVDLSSCLVMSGLIENGIVGKIRQTLEGKFHGQADPDLLNAAEPELPAAGYLAYAYLFRALPFRYTLNRLKEPLAFDAAQVTACGLRHVGARREDEHAAAQITVLDYKSDDDFIVALQPKDKNERIVLAKLSPTETLQKTIETVRLRIGATSLTPWQQQLRSGESLVVPILNFEIGKSYDEFREKSITTPGELQGMPIVMCLQAIRFRLDERGAVLKSEAKTVEAKCEQSHEEPRQLVFDKPFLILLERRESKQPYFALWVENAELLVPWK